LVEFVVINDVIALEDDEYQILEILIRLPNKHVPELISAEPITMPV